MGIPNFSNWINISACLCYILIISNFDFCQLVTEEGLRLVEGVGSAMTVEDAATMVVGWDMVEGTLEAEVVVGEDFQVAEAMLDTRGLIISDQAVVEEAVLVDQPPLVHLPEIEQGTFIGLLVSS